MKFFKSKKKALPAKQPEPRTTEELTKIHNDLCRRAGEVQYVITVNKDELSRLNEALRLINNEAGARNELDRQAAQNASAAEQNKEARNAEAQA